jgi:hypothetical protein
MLLISIAYTISLQYYMCGVAYGLFKAGTMPRCIAFEAIKGKVVRCKNRDIVVGTKVCRNAHCQSMGVRIWSADSAVSMTMYTYLCEGDVSPIDSMSCPLTVKPLLEYYDVTVGYN